MPDPPGIDLALPLISWKVIGLCMIFAQNPKIASFLEMF